MILQPGVKSAICSCMRISNITSSGVLLRLRFGHGYTPSYNLSYPFHMVGDYLGATYCCVLWKARCSLVEDKRTSTRAIIKKNWHRFRVYLHIEWKKLLCKVKEGRLDTHKARPSFICIAGIDEATYTFEGKGIVVAPSRPRPPKTYFSF